MTISGMLVNFTRGIDAGKAHKGFIPALDGEPAGAIATGGEKAEAEPEWVKYAGERNLKIESASRVEISDCASVTLHSVVNATVRNSGEVQVWNCTGVTLVNTSHIEISNSSQLQLRNCSAYDVSWSSDVTIMRSSGLWLTINATHQPGEFGDRGVDTPGGVELGTREGAQDEGQEDYA